MTAITITVDGQPIEVEPRVPLRPGALATANGVKLVVAAPLLVKALEFTEALERLSDGKMQPSEFGKVRREFITHTVRRNYPALPQSWFDELDTTDYQSLEQALQEASRSGEATAGNP
ncbi:hypothetical protein [Paraburkholderia pallida]|uniref:Uncharacterized protein n=1 Tax=Paraburkholderia pallida TaxID=2547399 RepID=A0A4P7CQP2_9BURK|nr:hypothetical protein [Paraburkholderia pallida]QBQ98170.1 hypothetical protein E1956_13960 [Paraburkholderia pallida]